MKSNVIKLIQKFACTIVNDQTGERLPVTSLKFEGGGNLTVITTEKENYDGYCIDDSGLNYHLEFEVTQ